MKNHVFNVPAVIDKTLPGVWPVIDKIVNHLVSLGAQVYLVGGAVRDIIMKVPLYDIDIEVHHLSPEQLQQALSTFGAVHEDGKSFGVLRVVGVPVDWSLPRSDSAGRKPQVSIDSALGIERALERRDVTMNAFALDLSTGALIDPFGGVQDIKDKILRTPNPDFFVQDPLRFYRVMQFIGRFTMYPDEQLQKLCATMDISAISVERVHAEFDKLMMLSEQPSRGFRWLRALGRIEALLPELAATIGVPQEPSWHPEGDVFEHSMQALDGAKSRLIKYAALCHDLGKVTTTREIDGRLRSFNHEQEGVEPARRLMKRLTGSHELIELVGTLTLYHMRPGAYVKQQAGPRAYKALAAELAPALNLSILAELAYADKSGRNPEGNRPLNKPLPDIDEFIERARAYGVLYGPEKPLLTGDDALALGLTGKAIGQALRKAYEYQIEHENISREEMLAYIRKIV